MNAPVLNHSFGELSVNVRYTSNVYILVHNCTKPNNRQVVLLKCIPIGPMLVPTLDNGYVMVVNVNFLMVRIETLGQHCDNIGIML